MDKLSEATQFLESYFEKYNPKTAVILGSGLGYLAEELQNKESIPTETIPHYARSTVAGHSGRLVFGYYYEKPVVFLQGRVHYYEGYSIQDVVFGIRILAHSGVQNLIVTNSAGGLNAQYRAGDLMIIEDHINMMFRNPLTGKNDDIGPRFPDMSAPYDREYVDKLMKIAINNGIPVHKGVYCAMTGPNYETKAEVKFLRRIGADAAGMSTVPEVITARQAGLRVAGISCISNLATGLSQTTLSHEEVTETANSIKFVFGRLVGQFLLEI